MNNGQGEAVLYLEKLQYLDVTAHLPIVLTRKVTSVHAPASTNLSTQD